MGYIYRHISEVTNQVIYIGKGEDENYKRAYSDFDRNDSWKKLLIEEGDFIVEIMFETDDLQLLKEKEKEFISLYGRDDLEKGTLLNRTDSSFGKYNLSPQSIQKIREGSYRKRLKTIDKLEFTIKNWDFTKNGKIDQKSLSMISGVSMGTIKRWCRYIKNSVKILNLEHKNLDNK